MATTPKFDITKMEEGQTGGELLFNEALQRIEAMGQITVEDVTNTPPGSPADGATYIVVATASGDWAGEEGNFAIYTTDSGWTFVAPWEGALAWIKNSSGATKDELQVYNGSSWVTQGQADIGAGPSQSDFNTLLANLRAKGILDPTVT